MRFRTALLIAALVLSACARHSHGTPAKTSPQQTIAQTCERDASVVHAAQPEFPDEARETGHPLERQVAIAVSVSADGRVRAARVVQSSGMAALDIAALLAAERSTYQPRIVHCRAVASPAVYRVTFSGGP